MRARLSALASACAALLGCSSSSSPPAPASCTLTSGDYALAVSDGGRSIALQRSGVTLLQFPADAFELGVVPSLDARLSYDPYFLEYSPNGSPPDQPTWLDVLSASATCTGTTANVTLAFAQGATATVSFEVKAIGRYSALFLPKTAPTGAQIAYMRLRPRASTSEAFYGMGEQEDSVDSRGKLRPMQLEVVTTTESPDNEVHFPIPLLIGTNGWGLFVQSKRVGLFDVARKAPDLVEVTYGTAEQSSEGLQFHLFAAGAPIDVTKLYYDVTGYPRLPAQWALGPWIRRDVDQDQAQVLDGVSKMQTLDLPTSAIWCDRRDESGVGAFDLDPTRFPDPAMMVQTVHDNGLRFAVWAGPYVQSSVQPTYDDVKSMGYFTPVEGIPANGWSAPIDFTNPQAYAFWQSLIEKDIDMGVEGFEMDYAEDIFPSILKNRNVWGFWDHSDDRTMHYGYTVLYHRAYQEMLNPAGSYLLCRAGRWGDQVNVAVTWPGDMDANMIQHGQTYVDHSGTTQVGVGGLPTTVIMGLTLGPSGFPFFASDTGGYRDSPPNNETFTRWFEQTALSTAMNVGDASSTEDPYSDTPWEFTPENGRNETTLDTYRDYARLHMRLFPYEWTYAQHIASDGRPITRAFGLVCPQFGVHPDDEYLFGDDLLVAPVVTAGATTRTLYMPPGDWIDWWQGITYPGANGGGRITVQAPLDTLPLFIRAGGVVPLLRPTIQRMAPTAMPSALDSFGDDAGVLYVRMVPQASAPAKFTLYDGGVIAATPQSGGGTAYTFRQGSVFSQGAVLEAIHAPMPSSVTRGGQPVPQMPSEAALASSSAGWFWEPLIGGRLWLRIAGDGQPVLAAR